MQFRPPHIDTPKRKYTAEEQKLVDEVQAQFDEWARDPNKLHEALVRALEGTPYKVKAIREE